MYTNQVSPKQQEFVRSMCERRDLTGISNETAQLIAEVIDGSATKAQASTVIDALKACPWKENAPLPENTRPARLAALEQARAAFQGGSTEAVHQAEEDYRVFRRGDPVIAVRGRKVRPGTRGILLTTNVNQWGLSFLVYTEHGEKVWSASTNWEHED